LTSSATNGILRGIGRFLACAAVCAVSFAGAAPLADNPPADAIGVIEGEQGDKQERERNDRIVAIENQNHSYAGVNELRDLGKKFWKNSLSITTASAARNTVFSTPKGASKR